MYSYLRYQKSAKALVIWTVYECDVWLLWHECTTKGPILTMTHGWQARCAERVSQLSECHLYLSLLSSWVDSAINPIGSWESLKEQNATPCSTSIFAVNRSNSEHFYWILYNIWSILTLFLDGWQCNESQCWKNGFVTNLFQYTKLPIP